MKHLVIIFFALILSTSLQAQNEHADRIKGPFDTPQAVTKACLECHEGVDKEIMQSRHWTWLGDKMTDNNGDTVRLGKKNMINNFCIALPSNYPRCTSCHIGYGWKDDSFDFADGSNIDCLVCHDNSGTYTKNPTQAGMPDTSVDLLKVAQSVGKPTNANCGSCHFNGGGGTGVKHGDLDGSMFKPSATLDVHMGKLGFTCTNCHSGENHHIKGAGQASMVAGTNHNTCTSCHTGDKVHKNPKLNSHTNSIACETCHIPTFAREEPTKTWWDWSTAGQDKEVEKDGFGMAAYDKKKGDFKWEKNVVPTYAWYNGKTNYLFAGDKIDPSKIVALNSLQGDIKDPNAKITPFKLMKGKQIYDTKHNYLIIPKLFGPGGYWKTFDWNAASKLGMEAVNLEYSGEYGFIETEMYWPINHMVAPKMNALKCMDCHGGNAPKRLDWAKLGYEGDPMKKGARKF